MAARHLARLALLAWIGFAGAGCALQNDDDDYASVDQEVRPPPATVTATATSISRITVNWSAVPMATKYYVYQSIGAAGPFAFKGTTVAPSTTLNVANLQANTQYCYVVYTDGADGVGTASSPPACATTMSLGPSTPPANVTATATSASRITVNWSSVAAATKYLVYQSTGSAGPYNFVGTVLQPTTTLAIANLQPATQYCFTVAAANNDGASPQSTPPACATTFIQGLEGFWKLNEGTGTSTEDLSGFARNGSLAGAIAWSQDLAAIDNNRFALASPGGAGDALNIADRSEWWFYGPFSLSVWVKVPSAPTGAVRFAGKRAVGCGAIDWELGQDATGLYFRGPSTIIRFTGSLTAGAWAHLAVTNDATDTVRVYLNGTPAGSGAFTAGPRSSAPMQFGNAGGCGSSPVSIDWIHVFSRQLTDAEVSTLGTRPATPTGFTATVAGATRVNLSWNAVAGASKYFLFKGTAAGNETFFASIIAPTTTFSDASNMPGTTTSWVVRSVMNGLISDPSTEQVVTTNPAIAAPTGVTAMTVGPTSIRINWTAVSGAVKYYIFQAVGAGPFAFKGTVLAGGTTYLAGGLTPNTSYSYYIVTQGPDSASTPSATVSATTSP